MNNVLLQTNHLSKIYTDDRKSVVKAVNDISLQIYQGETFGLVGESGCGKSTFGQMLVNLLEPTKGKITFDKMTYQKNEIEIKKQIAYLSGNTKLYDTLTCYELLKMCCDIYSVEKEEQENRIKEVTKVLKMDSFLHNKIENLSTGQTQKVNIARCLVHNPKYYILDEATTGLDIISSQIILDFIKGERKKKKTILYSTHYMEEAENICDRVIMINKGKIIKTGTPEEVKKDTKTTNLRDAFFALIGGAYNEE